MKSIRSVSALLVAGALMLVAGASTAAPKNFVFTGKFTSNRGILINIPVVGDTPCGGGAGKLSNLRIMSGPGLTGALMSMQPNPTPMTHKFSQFANGDKADYGCAGVVPGKKLTTTGAGVGGQFTIPSMVLSHKLPKVTTAIHVPNATPVIQLATSFAITGPKKVGTLIMSTSPSKSATSAMKWKANWRKFQKNAFAVQPGRVQGAMFSYCWGNPGCVNITAGSQPVIVKYTGGGNNFGGTMSYIINSGTNTSSLAIGIGAGVGFQLLAGMGSQVTGRGYAVRLTDLLMAGQSFSMYKLGTVTKPVVGMQKLITMVTGYKGPFIFGGANNYNRGFPFTTGTVLARNTGTVFGAKRDTTLTAKGGDTVTAMGKRNISLVAGGMARAIIGPVISNTPEIAQLYVPEPSRTAQLLAGVAALLGIAAWRARRAR
jgi:hypothetical protein